MEFLNQQMQLGGTILYPPFAVRRIAPKVALLSLSHAADERSRLLLWQDGEDPWRDMKRLAWRSTISGWPVRCISELQFDKYN